MKIDSPYSQYTEPVDVFLPTVHFLFTSKRATIHNMCKDANPRKPEIYKISYTWHENECSLLGDARCASKILFCVNDFLHTSYSNGCYPLRVWRCLFKTLCHLKDFLHTWHENGRSPVWIKGVSLRDIAGWKTSYTHDKKKDAPLCECDDVSSNHISKQQTVHTHHKKMDSLHCDCAYVPS